MPTFSTSTIARFETNAEQQFATERPCIIDRLALDITSGVGQYTIPNYVVNIRRVTYRGWKVYPLPHRDLRQSYLSGTQQGRPFWYIFNNVGQFKLQLFPVPSEDLIAVTTDLYGANIPNQFIIEFFRLPDVAPFQIPDYFRRRLLKCYIAKRCFEIEGKGMNVKAAKYWSNKFEYLKEVYGSLMDDLNNKPRNLVASDSAQRPYGYTPPPPMLPINRFGISVDEASW